MGAISDWDGLFDGFASVLQEDLLVLVRIRSYEDTSFTFFLEGKPRAGMSLLLLLMLLLKWPQAMSLFGICEPTQHLD